MRLDRVTGELDAFFRIGEFEPDSPFSGLVPAVYGEAGIDLGRFLEPAFLETCHGLMIRSGDRISRICGTVFLSDEIVDKVLSRGERDVLLITHHPLVMETSNRGFLPLSEARLAQLRAGAVSVYALHTPLDVHPEVSTSGALAREVGLQEWERYYPVPGGYAGVHGAFLTSVSFDDLLARVGEVSDVSDLDFIRHHQAVRTLGVIAGGTDVDGIQQTAELGCDLLLTGTYYNLVQNEIGKQYRDAFERVRDSLTVSLIGCSHYASEAVVMRTDIAALCADRLGVAYEFIPQDDPWY